MGADADQAEGAAVGLAGKQRFSRAQHLLRRLGGRLQVAGAGDDAEIGGLELERDALAGKAGLLHAPRRGLGQPPQDRAERVRVGQVLVERDLRGDALCLAVRIDRSVVLAAGAKVEPPADLAVSGDEGGLMETGELAYRPSPAWRFRMASPTPHRRPTGLSAGNVRASARPITAKLRGLLRSEAILARNLL